MNFKLAVLCLLLTSWSCNAYTVLLITYQAGGSACGPYNWAYENCPTSMILNTVPSGSTVIVDYFLSATVSTNLALADVVFLDWTNDELYFNQDFGTLGSEINTFIQDGGVFVQFGERDDYIDSFLYEIFGQYNYLLDRRLFTRNVHGYRTAYYPQVYVPAPLVWYNWMYEFIWPQSGLFDDSNCLSLEIASGLCLVAADKYGDGWIVGIAWSGFHYQTDPTEYNNWLTALWNTVEYAYGILPTPTPSASSTSSVSLSATSSTSATPSVSSSISRTSSVSSTVTRTPSASPSPSSRPSSSPSRTRKQRRTRHGESESDSSSPATQIHVNWRLTLTMYLFSLFFVVSI